MYNEIHEHARKDKINIHWHSQWFLLFGHSPNTTSGAQVPFRGAWQRALITCHP